HERVPFYVVRARGRNVRIVTVLEPLAGDPVVRGVQARGDTIEITTASGVDLHRFGGNDWTIERGEGSGLVLRGAREQRPPFVPLLQIDPPTRVAAPAFRVAHAPPLDGSLDGFELSAQAYAAWDERALYLAVAVTKPELCLRPGGASPLQLDNDPDDIHSDGLQVYLAPVRNQASENGGGSAGAVGYLIVPEHDRKIVRAKATSDTRGRAGAAVSGGWQRTESGYCVTVAIPWPEGVYAHAGAGVSFDLIVNELLPGRLRRVGQLVWSGGGGWVWLRGDRQDPSRFGVLELVG